MYEYRRWLDRLYAVWHGYNRDFFDSALAVPHIGIGRTAPRRFGQCGLTTDYGGQIDLTLCEGIVFGTNGRVVRHGEPAEGHRRFVEDVLLGESVKQYVLEVRGATEEGYGGYGPLYAAEATRIGERLGLPTVAARRRGYRGAGLPVAAFWPWAFRPEGYYFGDIHLAGRQMGGLRTGRRTVGHAAAVNEYLLFLLVTGQTARLRDLLERQVEADRADRLPAMAAAERSPLDERGRPKPLPTLPAAWVLWNDSCPARMAEFVAERRAFEVLPILADALEDAGCDDADVLEHCRRPGLHAANCWVLRAIRAAAKIDEPPVSDGE